MLSRCTLISHIGALPVNTEQKTAVILTALPVEYSAVRAHLSAPQQLVHSAGTVYEAGAFECDSFIWSVVIAETGVGNNIAAIETTRAIDTFQPAVVMFVGVAGGLQYVRPGDVVAADYVYGYESSKVTDVFQARIKTFGCGYPLVQRARAICRQGNWRSRIALASLDCDLDGSPRVDSPNACVGPIASGEQVLAGEKTATHKLLETHCGDTLAVEMEGWGFLFAAHTNGDVPAIVIRGISDRANADKTEAQDRVMQPIAAEHAAAFAFELLATFNQAESGRIMAQRPWRPASAQPSGSTRDSFVRAVPAGSGTAAASSR
jgi:nucleoside phosphorylase